MHGESVFHRNLDLANDKGLEVMQKLVGDVISTLIDIFLRYLFDLICNSRNGAEANGDRIAAVGVIVPYKECEIARITCGNMLCAACAHKNALFYIGF